MGQQLFIIAQLLHKGSPELCYRCITTVHDPWFYGLKALSACKAILDLLRNPENAQIVRAELDAIAATYSKEDRLHPFPAPFLSWMLLAAVRFRPEDKFVGSFPTSFVLDANMGSRDRGNDDGITIFDVTNPLDPSYCFASVFELEHVQNPVEVNTPLTAEQYVREYYAPKEYGYDRREFVAKIESEVLRLIESFKGERLIERWMLHQTWPWERYGRPVKGEKGSNPHPQLDASAILQVVTPSSTIPTLSELSLRKLIAQAQESGDISGLELALWLPGTASLSSMLNKLAELDHYSDAILAILIMALRDQENREADSLDLSPYALTSSQIIDVATGFPSTKVLNLNGSPHIDRRTLSRLLPMFPTLSRLNVYNCNGISASDIDDFRSLCPHLEVVYHRASMMRDFELLERISFKDGKSRPPPSFTFCCQSSLCSRAVADDSDLFGYSLKSHSPRQVVISLCDFHGCEQWCSERYEMNEKTALSVILSGLPRSPHTPFKNRTLGDLPLYPSLATEGWLYAAVRQAQAGVPAAPIERQKLVWGFVKYRFSTDVGGDRDSEAEGGARPVLQCVEVMCLTEWLQKVDPQQTVEREWVERLQETLKDYQLISEGRVTELIQFLTKW